tara:strand:+ start:14843 stop:15025 length:183 start_codon:yes stop_codon:yes gene_type:complete
MKFVYHNGKGVNLSMVFKFELRTDFRLPRISFINKKRVVLDYFEFEEKVDAQRFIFEKLI